MFLKLRSRFFLPYVCAVALAANTLGRVEGTSAAEKKLSSKDVAFFEAKIRPVLSQRCYACHSTTAKAVKGELRLDSRDALLKGGESGAAIVSGDPAESLLIQALKHETYEMPPGEKLPDSVIADFEKWIEMGAPDPRTKADPQKRASLADARKFWSLQPIKKPALPRLANAVWPHGDIDRFVLAKLEEKQITPVVDADRLTLLRRVTFDLTGLPPTPLEIEAFAKDQSSGALERVVDRLLESPQFGERWGRHWLDAVRYGESSGKERNIPYPYAWRYRDYVIDSINADKPYSRFVMEQVAGDLLPSKSSEEHNQHLIATGVLAIGTKGLNERKVKQFRADVVDEQIDVVSRAVIGLTISCARCHDHKFDPITQADYYALAGIFDSTEVFAGVKAGNNKSGYAGEYAYLQTGQKAETPALTAEEQEEIKKLQSDVQEANAKLARTSMAMQRLDSGAIPKQLQKLGSKPKEVREKVAQAAKRQREQITRLNNKITELQHKTPKSDAPVMAVGDRQQPHNAVVYLRGEVDQPGAEVQRGIPAVLSIGRPPKFESAQSGRLQLAAWLTSKENPLTARVMVNRTWMHLFGRGLVESVDNFGALGDEPSHPELLDYLAVRLVENKWSLKKLIREIVLTRTYQLSSVHNGANAMIDADNRYLWRMSRRRLEAEAIRDSMLAASGRLDLQRPAPPKAPENSANDMPRMRRMLRPSTDTIHRSVYLPIARGNVPEGLQIFDMADPSLPVGQREVTTVPTQALYLMNNPFVVEQCQATAKRLIAAEPSQTGARCDRLFLVCLGRHPSEAERKQTAEFITKFTSLVKQTADNQSTEQAAWASLVQSLFATGEFRHVY